MDLARRGIYLLAIMALFKFSMSTIHKVGDSAGWTTIAIGKIEYSKWAAARTFYVQDIIVFEYDAKNHNVMQVSLSDFHSCNGSTPLATYKTGNDSIMIKNTGHYYYICGFRGHCQVGMKVDIRVLRNLQSTTTTTFVPGNASSDDFTFTVPDYSPDDKNGNGIIEPETPLLAAAHCVISSNRFLSNKLGYLLLFLLELYLFCIFF